MMKYALFRLFYIVLVMLCSPLHKGGPLSQWESPCFVYLVPGLVAGIASERSSTIILGTIYHAISSFLKFRRVACYPVLKQKGKF